MNYEWTAVRIVRLLVGRIQQVLPLVSAGGTALFDGVV
jgi:hypothetical protein